MNGAADELKTEANKQTMANDGYERMKRADEKRRPCADELI